MLAALPPAVSPRLVSAADATAGAPRLSLTQSFPHGYIEATLTPGQSLHTALAIGDGGTVAATYRVLPVDGYTSSATGVVYGDAVTPFRDGADGNGELGAGHWISVGASSVHIQPGQQQDVTVVVTVPPGTPPGDWIGGVSVENPAPAPAASAGAELNITEAAAMAVVVHVPGADDIGALFLGRPTVVAHGVEQFLRIPLRYTGNLLVKPVFAFTLTDSHGSTVARRGGRFDTFVPHTAMTYEVPLIPSLAPGAYTFTASAGPDGNVITFTDPVTVVSSAVPAAPPRPSSATSASWARVLLALPILLLLMLLAVLAASRRRNRCTHCGGGRLGRLMTVTDFHEIARCAQCRRHALDRETVRLCPECYRRHVLPAPSLTARPA